MLKLKLIVKPNTRTVYREFSKDMDLAAEKIKDIEAWCSEVLTGLLVGEVFFKRTKRESWKSQLPLSKLSMQDLLFFQQNNPESFFELRVFLSQPPEAQPEKPTVATLVKKYLTLDYYGCIQLNDGAQQELTQISLTFRKELFEDVLEVLGLHDLVI